MIVRLTVGFAALPPTRFVLGDADRSLSGTAGTIVVIGVESGKIPAARNPAFACKQDVQPGSTRKPFVLTELPDSGKLDTKQRFICPRPLCIGAGGSMEAAPRTCRSSMLQWSRTPVFEEYR
ncbi:MAG TPA: hypothetical protein VHM93_02150 [Candidatus Acidoferrum sp.]|nr:hypothetical protein [Candidatus Acidoferrum sp.]